MRQFAEVDCRRGSPHGRRSSEELDGDGIRLFKVRLSCGYDDGGAYWGEPSSPRDTLWCARDALGTEKFTRCATRGQAAYYMDIEPTRLASKAGMDEYLELLMLEV